MIAAGLDHVRQRLPANPSLRSGNGRWRPPALAPDSRVQRAPAALALSCSSQCNRGSSCQHHSGLRKVTFWSQMPDQGRGVRAPDVAARGWHAGLGLAWHDGFLSTAPLHRVHIPRMLSGPTEGSCAWRCLTWLHWRASSSLRGACVRRADTLHATDSLHNDVQAQGFLVIAMCAWTPGVLSARP